MAIELTAKAEKLYACIREKGGGTLAEWWLRDKTGMSHGSFCAARKELAAAGLIILGKDVRKTTYTLAELSPQAGTEKAGGKLKVQEADLRQEEAFMPRAVGDFGDFDDWLLALNEVLGDCVEVSRSLVEENLYWVFAPEYGGEDCYQVRENDTGGITVE